MRLIDLDCIDRNLYEKASTLWGYSFYHTEAWHEVLMRSFGWRVRCLVLELDDQIVGFLPYCRKYRIGGGLVNVSLPFSHLVEPAVRKPEYVEIFCQHLESRKIKIEIHSPVGRDVSTLNYCSMLTLNNYKSKEVYFNALDAKSCKYMIKRAIKEGVVIEKSCSLDSFKKFYSLELNTRKRLGAPMYPRSFFENICNQSCSDNMQVYLALYKDRAVAGLVVFKCKDIAIYAYGATTDDRDIKKLGGNELVLYSAIGDCIDAGFSTFDFGTTPLHLKNLLKFKEKWKADTVELPYTYFETNVNLKRDGAMVRVASFVLRNMPSYFFRYLSPLLLKAII